VERPDSPFVLRAGVPMPGAMPVGEAADLVVAEWQRQAAVGQISEGTVATHSAHLARLVKFAAARGAGLVCDLSTNVLLEWTNAANGYTGQPVPDTTRYARKAVASAFFHTCYRLGITDQNPAQTLPARKARDRYVHPFTPEQIDRLKDQAASAHKETKGPTALALVLLGCSSGEVGAITARDVYLTQMLVDAHGGGDRYAQRWLPIDDPWCFDQLAARLRALADKHPGDWQDRFVAYDPQPGKDDDARRRAAATSMTVGKVIERAGLKVNGVTRVASITESVARRVFLETGRVEAVAARLGLPKLDDAAHLCGYDWQTEMRQPGPSEQDGGRR
jgi:integrase